MLWVVLSSLFIYIAAEKDETTDIAKASGMMQHVYMQFVSYIIHKIYCACQFCII